MARADDPYKAVQKGVNFCKIQLLRVYIYLPPLMLEILLLILRMRISKMKI